jgi:hypothetical protein
MTTETQFTPALADDLLEGADAIAEFICGDRKKRRKIYHLIETKQIPAFHLGGKVCARKSAIMAAITEKERRASVT